MRFIERPIFKLNEEALSHKQKPQEGYAEIGLLSF